MNGNDSPRWLLVEDGLEWGPFTDWERAEIDSVRTPRARYIWVRA